MIEESKHYYLAIACGAKRGPKDSDLTFSPASLRDFVKVLVPPEQEPFGYFKAEPFGWTDCASTDEGAIALYEHPPQRQWVGLTDEDIEEISNSVPVDDISCHTDTWHIKFARAIEAKLKEKNNG